MNGFRVMLTALTRELRADHEVRVLAFRSPDQAAPPNAGDVRLLPRPEGGPGATLATLYAAVRGRPLRADRLSAAMEAPLRAELDGFRPDVVHVTSGRLAGVAPALAHSPSVLGALDAMHRNFEARALVATGIRRPLLRAEVSRVKRYEATHYRRFGHVVVVSDADRDALLELDPSLAITVIPNGVDARFFAPREHAAIDPNRIVFTGVMSYAPNVLAAEFLAQEVFPRVRAEHPAARLAIVGRTPSARVLALSELDGVDVVGEVPDLRPWLQESRVYACPMTSGTGIKNKLLEAMACGLPSVVTPRALQGLDVGAGEHVLVGMGPDELAGELLHVLRDTDLAARLGAAAREYVRTHHDWGAVALRYVDVWENVRSLDGARR